MPCAVIILNWNGAELLKRYLPHLIAHSPTSLARLIVADNGSEDNSLEVLHRDFPQIEVLELHHNYGFAEGYNRAIEAIEEPLICLLNSDVRVAPHWLETPLKVLEKAPSVAALQPKIRAERQPEQFEYAGAAGGYIDRLGYPFCRGRIFDTVEEDHGQYDNPIQPVLWASGACLFVRRSVYLEVGGLDHRFFAHQEEIDLCWRMAARGHRIVAVSGSEVYHYGGASLNMGHPKKTYLNFRNNMLMLYKNMPDKQYRSVVFLRRLLDLLSAIQQLFSGRWQHTRAILRAMRDFARMREEFSIDRKINLEKTVRENPEGIRPYAIVWQYFVKRRHTYDAIENQRRS